MTLAQKLGVRLEPVNFPNHFLLRWCQKPRGYVFETPERSINGKGRIIHPIIGEIRGSVRTCWLTIS